MSNKPTHWDWNDTELADEIYTDLSTNEIEQFLSNRGEEKSHLKHKKLVLINKLKQKYNVNLQASLIKNLTAKQLLLELKLRGLNCSSAKKNVLIERINSSIPPPRDPNINKHIPWKCTQIQELPIDDLKQLLLNRDINTENIPIVKDEAIKLLTQKYAVKLNKPPEYLRVQAIEYEIKLFSNNIEYYGKTKSELVTILNKQIKRNTKARPWIFMNRLKIGNISNATMISYYQCLLVVDTKLMIYD
eukprot:93406_1